MRLRLFLANVLVASSTAQKRHPTVPSDEAFSIIERQVVERGIPEIRGTEAAAGGVFSKLTGAAMLATLTVPIVFYWKRLRVDGLPLFLWPRRVSVHWRAPRAI